MLLILGWLPINVWAAVNREQALRSAGYLLLGMAYYLALTHWPLTRRRPALVAWLLIAVGTLFALLGPRLVELQAGARDLYAPFGLPATLHLARFGEAVNPNILAGALLLLFSLPCMLAIDSRWTTRLWPRIGVGLLLLCMVVVIDSTQSRGAELAIVFVVALLLALRWPQLIFGMLFLLVLGIGAVVWVGPHQFLEMLFISAATPGLDQRIEIWSRAWYALYDFVFTGIGIGSFEFVIPRLYPYFLISPAETIPHAHNLYLQIGLDLGVPGLIAYGALWINLWVMLVTLLRRREDPFSWCIAAGAFGSLVGMLLHGLVDAVTWGNKLAFLPWWLYALITLLFLQQQQPAQTIESR
jgi:putative inorganic carbon (hco3(-)) transporter